MGAKGTNRGKAATEKTGLGRTIIKQRFGGAARRREEPTGFLHTTELDDGASWTKYQSITEQNDLDTFLSTAELAGTEFTAERTNVKVVTPVSPEIKLHQQYRQEMLDVMEEKKHLLTIPRRPQWTSKMAAEELQLREREAFLNWRRHLADLQQDERLVMTPFERNLEVWRQLWRVVERSDLVVQIVDARNPLLFRSTDLEAYVKQIDERKENLLVVNKADMLTIEQRAAWARHFRQEKVRFVFFSAELGRQELEAQKSLLTDENSMESDDLNNNNKSKISFYDSVTRLNLQDKHRNNSMDILSQVNEDGVFQQSRTLLNPVNNKSGNENETETSDDQNNEEDSEDSDSMNDLSSDIDDEEDVPYQPHSLRDINDDLEHIHSMNREDAAQNDNIMGDAKILGRNDLFNLFRKYSPIRGEGESGASASQKGPARLTVGMVGYPNVGKSSTINVLVGKKRVAVASTPGKTKHFQTINIDDDICLCDCPGLVFPSFAASKAEMVLNGILPIDQLRDHISPATVLCQRFPRSLLEATYGITLMLPGKDEDKNRSPTAYEFLSAVAQMRGFMKSGFGVPDDSRAARIVLKDYVDGKLLYCHPPPRSGLNEQQFNQRQFQSRLSYLAMKKTRHEGEEKQIAAGKQASLAANAQLPDKNAAVLRGLPTFHDVTGPKHKLSYVDELDEAFFNKKEVKVQSQGKVPLSAMHSGNNVFANGKKHHKNSKRRK